MCDVVDTSVFVYNQQTIKLLLQHAVVRDSQGHIITEVIVPFGGIGEYLIGVFLLLIQIVTLQIAIQA